jgi:hypothetical protein
MHQYRRINQLMASFLMTYTTLFVQSVLQIKFFSLLKSLLLDVKKNPLNIFVNDFTMALKEMRCSCMFFI